MGPSERDDYAKDVGGSKVSVDRTPMGLEHVRFRDDKQYEHAQVKEAGGYGGGIGGGEECYDCSSMGDVDGKGGSGKDGRPGSYYRPPDSDGENAGGYYKQVNGVGKDASGYDKSGDSFGMDASGYDSGYGGDYDTEDSYDGFVSGYARRASRARGQPSQVPAARRTSPSTSGGAQGDGIQVVGYDKIASSYFRWYCGVYCLCGSCGKGGGRLGAFRGAGSGPPPQSPAVQWADQRAG